MAVVEKALLVVLTRHLKLAMSRLVRGACPIRSYAKRVARCSPFLPGKATASGAAGDGRHGGGMGRQIRRTGVDA